MSEIAVRNYHLGFAEAVLIGIFDEDVSIGEALRHSWKPGTTISRYGRRWHLTKILSEDKGVFVGRIGFVAEDEVSTLRFDPELNDFVWGEAPSGVVVPFAIRERDGVIAFQLRPGVVRETTFTGALEELLNVSGTLHLWEIRTFTEERSFWDWNKAYPLITRFDVTVERPNPHYFGADKIEDAIEQVRLESLKLVGKAREGESIDTSADLFRQALDHVGRNYGKAKIVGMSEDGSEGVWVKPPGVTSGRVASKILVRGIGEEVVPEDLLVQSLDQAPHGELVNLNAQDDD